MFFILFTPFEYLRQKPQKPSPAKLRPDPSQAGRLYRTSEKEMIRQVTAVNAGVPRLDRAHGGQSHHRHRCDKGQRQRESGRLYVVLAGKLGEDVGGPGAEHLDGENVGGFVGFQVVLQVGGREAAADGAAPREFVHRERGGELSEEDAAGCRSSARLSHFPHLCGVKGIVSQDEYFFGGL
jgi:hypothetical protein